MSAATARAASPGKDSLAPAADEKAATSGQEITMRLRGVKRVFDTPTGEYTALSDITFDVPEGQFLAVVGPSGCGKSTLLTLISGLAFPEAGEVEVLGSPVTAVQKNVGFIFQRDALLPWRTALQNVALPLTFRGMGKSEARDVARSWLSRVGLKSFEDNYPHQLSGGMRKRVAIAATLCYEPRVLLMDEPFSALDVETRTIMENDLLHLWDVNRPTVMFITHDLQEAVSLADRVLVMSAGPGQIIGDYEVDLARPRNLLELRFDDKLIAIQHKIWNQLRDEVVRAYDRQ